MKKLLLAFVSVVAFQFVNAQCTPDFSQTEAGIFPDSATNFLPATELQPYAQTITAVVPVDTCAQVLPLPLPCTVLSMDSIVVESVTGLPTGLTFQCSNPNCQFLGGTTDCAIISGTPAAGTAGTWPLVIELNAYVGGLGLANPFTLTYYEIVVLPAGSSVTENATEAFAVKQNQPNPFDELTTIEYTLNQSGKVYLEVFNIVGENVDSKVLNGSKGVNRVAFDGSELANGAYIYKMTANGVTVTHRMIINR